MSAYDDHLLKVADLIDRPGASRRVDLTMPVPEGFELPLVALTGPVGLEGVVESVVDGLLVRGTLRTGATLACARCLTEVEVEVAAEVTELYTDPHRVSDPGDEPVEEGYEIQDMHIDLDALLRDALAPALPFQPLCSVECRGLCADCGTNRNEVECACAEEAADPRWAVLEHLRLPDAGD